MSDPYADDGAVDPVSPAATGVYVEGSGTYASSIDSAVTGLYVKWAYDVGCATAAPAALPIVVMIHGYVGDADSLQQSDLRRWAARGFLAASVGMRGRNGAAGARDASARECYDAGPDLLAYLRSTLPLVAHPTHAGDAGWSGGGGSVLALRVRHPDLFTVSADFFGIASYSNWYTFGAALGSVALLDADVGGSPAVLPDAYAARDARTAIARAIAATPLGWLHVLHDTGDTSVSVSDSQAVAAALAAAGLSQYTYTETTGASPTRALHGHPVDHAELVTLERIFARRMRDTATATLAASGTLDLHGYVVSATQNFEVWLGGTASPRTNGIGGRDRVALLAYDATAGTYTITCGPGVNYAYVRAGSFVAPSIPFDGRTIVVDAVAGTVEEIVNDLDGAVAVGWAAKATAAPLAATVAGAPTVARAVQWYPADRRRRTTLSLG